MELPVDEQIDALNGIRRELHQAGPFSAEPVDLVLWVKSQRVVANDYNPNKVAPPEMTLLRRSVTEDGYTQPIVTCPEDGAHTVVDGFHRREIGTTVTAIASRLHGYLPVTAIRDENGSRSGRIASTIRHNRARGTHETGLMVNIIGELVSSGMSDAWIMKSIGMDADELLRLKQISGLAALFRDKEFSQAWAKDDEDAAR
ncbi:hypothetical protein CRQ24_23170, partial [Salmonella enterica subsp. enterica serovar Derby]|nr:hypothetical protein [Salmonella enterica subsp. enterica serovar Derby]